MGRRGPKAKRTRKKKARKRQARQERKLAEKREQGAFEALRSRLELDEPRANLKQLRAELDAWLDPFDAFDVISSVALAAYLDRRSDSGSHPQLASYVVEYVTVHLLRRDRRAPVEADPNPAGWNGDMQALDFLLNRTLITSRDAEGRSSPSTESLTQAQRMSQFRYMTQQLFAHDPVPPERELDRLMTLFQPFEERLYQHLGVTAIMAAAICTATSVVKAEGLASFFDLGDIGDPLAVRAELQCRADRRDPPELGLIIHEGIGEAIQTSPAKLATIIGIPAANVEAFLAPLAIRFGEIRDGDPWQQIRVLRSKPVLEDGKGNWLVPVPYDLLYVVRGVLEDALRDIGLLEDFQKRRAEYLEEEARSIFKEALKPDLVLRSLSYEHSEDGEVKFPEADALVVVDGIAFACEDKAGGLSPAARGGEPRALAKAFNRLLLEAIEQAERTRAALSGGQIISGVDESTKTIEIDPDQVSRVVPIAVTLEDLSGPSSKLWELMDKEPTGVAPEDWPWIVNIDDLGWFADELPLAAELVHYVIVRQRLASAGEMTIGNEADWFRFYRNQGAARAQAIVENAQEGNFNTRLLSVSDARRGRFDPDLPPADLAVTPLLKRLDEERPVGWLTTSLALLDLHPEQGAEILWDLPRRLQRASSGYVGTASLRPAADPDTLLTIRIGSLDTGPHKRAIREEPGVLRRAVLALDNPLERLAVACRAEQPTLAS